MYRIRSDDPIARGRAFQTLVRAYWKPVYKHIRIRWKKSNEEAKDLTQSFFARCFEKRVFEAYKPELALFRTFVRRCVDNHVRHHLEAFRRIKRGGDLVFLSLDCDEAELELQSIPDVGLSAEEAFEREWIRNLHAMSVEALEKDFQARGREICFEVFRIYELSHDQSTRPTYQSVAADFSIKVTDVTNFLAAARRRFRSIVLEKLEELTASEEEYNEVAKAILGIDLTSGN